MSAPPEHPGPTQRRPTAIDLFAGAGGFALGFEQAGFDVVAAVEYDPIHAAVHEFNFPRTEVLCRDAARLDAHELRAAIRRGMTAHGRDPDDADLDAVFGGPPCQGFSTMGKRRTDDVRNRLSFAFAEIVNELQPRYFVLENVPGMPSALGDHGGPLIEELVERFVASGYRVRPYKVLNAANFGVPQDRRRLILLGWRSDQPPIDHPSPTFAPVLKRGGREDGGSELLPGPSVWDAIGDLPDLDKFAALLTSDEVRLSSRDHARVLKKASPYVVRLRDPESDPGDYSYPRIWDERCMTSSHRTQHRAEVTERFAATAPGETEATSRFYRLHPEGLSCTLRAGTGYDRGSFNAARPIHPLLPRVISVREAARLQSFPDWFRFHWTKWHGFRQVGNSLPPLLGRALADQIATALEVERKKPTSLIALGDEVLLMLNMTEASEHFGAKRDDVPHHGLRLRKKRQVVAEAA